MKRLLLLLLLIPSLAFATYTEFYAQSGGSNINACSTNNNTAVYSTVHGNWTQSTGVFTPTDSSTPASTVSVGMWAAVFVDGATEAVWIGRISAVGAGTNGAITANTTGIGAKPANQTSTCSIVVGGACQGPNAASGFPLTLTNWGNNQDATAHRVRMNLKNDQTYTMTASFAVGAGSASTIQGYTTNPGDGGRATFDGTTNTTAIISSLGSQGVSLADCIFTSSVTSGTGDLVITALASVRIIGCVFTGARNNGLAVTAGSTTVIECEAYNNNVNNTANRGGFNSTATGAFFYRCISHDNAGSNTAGFQIVGANTTLQNCVSDTNGHFGAAVGNGNVLNCDFYNNGSDAINIAAATAGGNRIENCNFFKNTGLAINNVSVINAGHVYNCVYGSGTQVGGGGSASNVLNNFIEASPTTYTTNLTPWVDPANGNFGQSPLAGIVGRGLFLTTASSYGPTVGYPKTGAAEEPSATPTPTATATATFTPTPSATSTATATATFTPTPSATATASFTPCAICVPTPTPSATFTPTPTVTPTNTPTPTSTPTPIINNVIYGE